MMKFFMKKQIKKIKQIKKRSSQAKNFSQVKNFLKTVSDENRLRILFALKGRVMNVTEIHEKLNLPQNLTSHHLSKLKKAGLLVEKSKGTFRNYSISAKKLKECERMFKKIIGV